MDQKNLRQPGIYIRPHTHTILHNKNFSLLFVGDNFTLGPFSSTRSFHLSYFDTRATTSSFPFSLLVSAIKHLLRTEEIAGGNDTAFFPSVLNFRQTTSPASRRTRTFPISTCLIRLGEGLFATCFSLFSVELEGISVMALGSPLSFSLRLLSWEPFLDKDRGAEGVFLPSMDGRISGMEFLEGEDHYGRSTVSFYSWFAMGWDCGGEGTRVEDLRSVSSFDKKAPRLIPSLCIHP